MRTFILVVLVLVCRNVGRADTFAYVSLALTVASALHYAIYATRLSTEGG